MTGARMPHLYVRASISCASFSSVARRGHQVCTSRSKECLACAGNHFIRSLLAPAQTQDEVQGRFLLDVVVRQGAAVLQLLACEDEALLVRRDALLILDLCLDIVYGVGSLHIQSDGLAGQCLDKDLHASAEAEDEVERGLLLNVVVRQSPAVLQLLASKDEALLVRRDA